MLIEDRVQPLSKDEILRKISNSNNILKKKRNLRMNKISLAQKAELLEYKARLNRKNNDDKSKKDKKNKINKSTDILQKNILTGSRSSFVKSTLKP